MNPRFSVKKARRAQKSIAKKVIAEDRLPSEIKLVAGVDATYVGEVAVGAVAVLDFESLKVLEVETAVQSVKFPYIPTLLSFRELPVVVEAVRKLKLQPDVFLVDAHGRAHPYRCGFACHLGVTLSRPTIGAAKSRLVGERKQLGKEEVLVDAGEVVASVVYPEKAGKPVYVSVGHMVSLETAVKIVRHCMMNSRAPEPILQAHKAASEKRKTLIEASANS